MPAVHSSTYCAFSACDYSSQDCAWTDSPLDQYDAASAPNRIRVIYKDADSATNLLRASPLRFSLEPVNVSADDAEASTSSPNHGPFTPASGEGDALSVLESETRQSHLSESFSNPSGIEIEQNTKQRFNASRSLLTAKRNFHVFVEQSHVPHAKAVEHNPYYWGFKPLNKTLPYKDIVNRVPHIGLADFVKDRAAQPAAMLQQFRNDLERRPSLREMWDEGSRIRDQRAKEEEIRSRRIRANKGWSEGLQDWQERREMSEDSRRPA